MLLTLFQVALGGAIGAALRHLVQTGATRLLGGGFPWGTLAVNVAGSFLMGALFAAATQGSGRLSPFLAAGLLGGFTTFSAFSIDAMALYARGQTGLAGLYVAGSVALSLAGAAAGIAAVRGTLP